MGSTTTTRGYGHRWRRVRLLVEPGRLALLALR
jgi:hypothetical protein